ncbi:hypothetical protein FA13DRAFT_287738 [Coprinellus micaceus]|uniref:Uncharacterized protein n=1 Tax=Coprinellus micaceus TaxID=71717 RepID=A0A4Y7TDY2_COPMI|nr:hypothetical protein FA13DRAFT_287738 [Coprinellus micaceus]
MIWKSAKSIGSRSSDTPLTINIDPLPPYADFPDKLYRIGATSDRWEKLTASGHTMVVIFLASLEAQIDLPNLRSLKLLGSDPNLTAKNILSMDSKRARYGFPNSTKLGATLHIGENAPNLMLRESLPWSCVTRLTIDLTSILQNRYGWYELGETFHQLRAVSRLSLQSTDPRTPHSAGCRSDPSWHLPEVRFLSISAPDACLWYILSQLQFPAINHLVIERKSLRMEIDITPLFSFFLTHCPWLRHLTTNMVDIEQSLKVVQRCQPDSVVLTNAFSQDPQARSSTIRTLRYIIDEEPTTGVKNIVLCDASRLSLPLVTAVLDVLNTFDAAVPREGGTKRDHPTTSITIRSASPLPPSPPGGRNQGVPIAR